MRKEWAPANSQEIKVLPGSRFLLAWADPAQRAEVVECLAVLGRQTMNLRMMPTAHILTLVDAEREFLVGFCGVDNEHDPRFPELFSLHLDEAYRTFKLGLLLETARAQFLLDRGHEVAYTRMEESSNLALLASRLNSGMFTRLTPDSIDERYTGMCRHCDLYNKSCLSQAFLRVDLKALAKRGIERLGALDFTELPMLFELSESIFRKVSSEAAAEQAAKP